MLVVLHTKHIVTEYRLPERGLTDESYGERRKADIEASVFDS